MAQKQNWEKTRDMAQKMMKGAHKDVSWNKTFGYNKHSKRRRGNSKIKNIINQTNP